MREYLVILDPRRSTHCYVCMSGEFIHVTLLSVFGTVLVDTQALVSNMGVKSVLHTLHTDTPTLPPHCACHRHAVSRL